MALLNMTVVLLMLTTYFIDCASAPSVQQKRGMIGKKSGGHNGMQMKKGGMRKVGMHKGRRGMHKGKKGMHPLHRLGRSRVSSLPARSKPNIILILTDDQDVLLGGSSYMPQARAVLQDAGLTFDNFVVNYALCCPSRATILTGKCMHNTGIKTNQNPDGGWQKFRASGLEQDTIATRLHAMGYRTGLIGKYMNAYKGVAKIPPGWDTWFAFVNDQYGYYNYHVSNQGRLQRFENSTSDYSTDVFTRKAVEFIKVAERDPRPFFLFLAPYAPHQPSIPANRHIGRLKGIKLPRNPSFTPTDTDMQQKVWAVRNYPPFKRSLYPFFDFFHQMRAETMLAVDDMVAEVVVTLMDMRLLNRTYLFLTSDNGYHLGNHRMSGGKQTPYEYDIRVPFWARGPGIPAKTKRKHLVGNIDLMPTIVELAGGRVAPGTVDGISFARLLTPGKVVPEDAFRSAFLVEKLPISTTYTGLIGDGDLLVTDAVNSLTFQQVHEFVGPDGEGMMDVLNEFRGSGLRVVERPNEPDGTAGAAKYPNCLNSGSNYIADDPTLYQCAALYAQEAKGLFSDDRVMKGGETSLGVYIRRNGFQVVDYLLGNGFGMPVTYYAMRVATSRGHFKFISFPTGYELYNLTADPYEMRNIYRSAPDRIKTGFGRTLKILISCKGNNGPKSCTVTGTAILGL